MRRASDCCKTFSGPTIFLQAHDLEAPGFQRLHFPLPSFRRRPHIARMATPPKKPRSTRAKASRPDVSPLEPHLAALLSPGLVAGFEEAPQAAYEADGVSGLTDEEIEKYGLGEGVAGGGGVQATIDSLDQLLRLGDPNLRSQQPWTPHRPERPPKSEGGVKFEIVSEYTPKGDQPAAIEELVKGIEAQEREQVLLGVTGSGKTFTMAQVIERTQRPALILAPNKTLAAQLYGEFRSFFPNNAVEYFVSYYDYYQPEAYVPRSDTYIEKEFLRKRADRPDAPRGDARAAGARRRHHRRLRVLHLRHWFGGDLHRDDVWRDARREAGAAPARRRSRGVAVSARAGGFSARDISRARRHDRRLSGPL